MTPALETPFEVARWAITSYRHRLPMFVITDHPVDFPDGYVARLHVTLPKPQVTSLRLTAPTLEALQAMMWQLGLVKLNRHPQDDPVIIETWV